MQLSPDLVEITFKFTYNGETVSVHWINKGKGKIKGFIYPRTYEVFVNINGGHRSYKTGFAANITNCKHFINKVE